MEKENTPEISQGQPQVFIERASPLTKNGIQSMCCTEKEYEWYCKGLEDGRKKVTNKPS